MRGKTIVTEIKTERCTECTYNTKKHFPDMAYCSVTNRRIEVEDLVDEGNILRDKDFPDWCELEEI